MQRVFEARVRQLEEERTDEPPATTAHGAVQVEPSKHALGGVALLD